MGWRLPETEFERADFEAVIMDMLEGQYKKTRFGSSLSIPPRNGAGRFG